MDVRKLVDGALVSCVRLREVLSPEGKDQGAWDGEDRGKEVGESFGGNALCKSFNSERKTRGVCISFRLWGRANECPAEELGGDERSLLEMPDREDEKELWRRRKKEKVRTVSDRERELGTQSVSQKMEDRGAGRCYVGRKEKRKVNEGEKRSQKRKKRKLCKEPGKRNEDARCLLPAHCHTEDVWTRRWGQLLLTGEVVNFMQRGTALHAEALLLTRMATWLEERRHSINYGGVAGKMSPDRHSFIMECVATYSPCEQCVECIKEFRSKTGVRVILRCCRLYELNPRHPSNVSADLPIGSQASRRHAVSVLDKLAQLGRDFSLLSPENLGHLQKRRPFAAGRHLDQVPSSMLRGYTAYALGLGKMLKRMRINTEKYSFLEPISQLWLEPGIGKPQRDDKAMGTGQDRHGSRSGSMSMVEKKLAGFGLYLHPLVVSRIEGQTSLATDLSGVMEKHGFQGHFAVSPCLCRGNCLRCCPCRQSHRHCTPLCGGHRGMCQSQQHDS
uniref:uncharacterized protein n=1 Tax=Myxine glutinosa TaxID=7769 RepID=UPI00358F0EA6